MKKQKQGSHFLDGFSEEWWEEQTKKWIAGKTIEDAVEYAEEMNAQGKKVLMNVQGERTDKEEQIDWFMKQYEKTIEEIKKIKLHACISVKLTAIGLLNSEDLAEKNLECLLRMGNAEIDMENREYVERTINLAEKMLKRGYKFRLAMQAGLKDAGRFAEYLKNIGEEKISFRICTGSCYGKNGNGYKTTLELDERETNEQFYKLMNLYKDSAVATGKLERILYAKKLGMEIQCLKGEENGKADTIYAGFRDWKTNKGVRSYILRRQKIN